jgi:hypothetical protein
MAVSRFAGTMASILTPCVIWDFIIIYMYLTTRLHANAECPVKTYVSIYITCIPVEDVFKWKPFFNWKVARVEKSWVTFWVNKKGGGSVTNVNHRHANYNEQSIVISTNHGRGLRVHNANVTKGKTTELLTQLVYMGSRCGSAVKRWKMRK